MGKILITGNSGYIGSHLSQILLKDLNLEVHGLDKNDPIIPLKISKWPFILHLIFGF